MHFKRAALMGALLSAGVAAAQPYVVSSAPASYAGLSHGTDLTLSHPSSNATTRDGRASVSLPFAFPFYDKAYDRVTVTAHGMLVLEPNLLCPTCTYRTNRALPSTMLPDGIIAPLWDDLDGKHLSSRIRYEHGEDLGGRYFAVEWVDWGLASVGSDLSLTFQARLYASGVIEFRYGAFIGTGALSASMGIEAPDGRGAMAARACSRREPAQCSLADYPSFQTVRIGPAVNPELSAVRVEALRAEPTPEGLRVTAALTARNFGQLPTPATRYRLYLSANETYEPSLDVAWTPAEGELGPMGPLEVRTFEVSGVVPLPSGPVRVLAQLDSDDQVDEANEENNWAVSAPLVPGVELVARSVAGPFGGRPGQELELSLAVANRGLRPAASAELEIWLSVDAALGAEDFLLFRGQRALEGAEALEERVTVRLPTNIPAGNYQYVLRTSSAANEWDLSNNLVFGESTFVSHQPDLKVSGVELLQARPPFDPTQVGFFGEPARLRAQVENLGSAVAQDVSVQFFLSDNDTLNAFSDSLLSSAESLTLAPGQSLPVEVDVVVPTVGPWGAPLVAGNYRFFAAAIGPNMREPSVLNNIDKSPLKRVRTPAPDLVPVFAAAPSRVGVGERLLVSRTIRNIGARGAGPARYRVVLSANLQVTEQDPELLPVSARGGLFSVALEVGQTDTAVEALEVPRSIPPGRYYLGLLVDPAGPGATGDVEEVFEDNNGAAFHEVEVVAAARSGGVVALPDAVLGMTYTVDLPGAPAEHWLPEGGAVPPGLRLESSGRLLGVPSAVGAYQVRVLAEAGSEVVEHLLVLRVVPASGALSVVDVRPPTAWVSQAYRFPLAALGGVAPYRWRVVGGALPPGMTLTQDGVLEGAPAEEGVFGTTVELQDALGSRTERRVDVSVVSGSELYIETQQLPAAQASAPYVVDLVARRPDKKAGQGALRWTLVGGALPDGLGLTHAEDVLLIEGTPLEAGIFPFSLLVQDPAGRADTADFVLVVRPAVDALVGEVPSVVQLGETVAAQLSLSTGAPADFRLVSGAMPEGLRVSPDGRVEGVVAATAELRAYTFVVEAHGAGGRGAMRALTLAVTPAAAAAGCQAGPGQNAKWLCVLAAVTAARHLRRRRHGLAGRPKSS